VAVERIVCADPYVAFRIDVQPVLVPRPIVALARAAPRLHDIAIAIELDHLRRLHAAFRHRRFLRGRELGFRDRRGPVQDPYMVAVVHGNARDLAEHPVIRQRLRP
jgi:hypothetical protein